MGRRQNGLLRCRANQFGVTHIIANACAIFRRGHWILKQSPIPACRPALRRQTRLAEPTPVVVTVRRDVRMVAWLKVGESWRFRAVSRPRADIGATPTARGERENGRQIHHASRDHHDAGLSPAGLEGHGFPIRDADSISVSVFTDFRPATAPSVSSATIRAGDPLGVFVRCDRK